MPSLPRYLLTEGRLLEPWRARGLPRGRRLDSGWEGGGFLGTAARRLAAWPLWLVHLSGSRVVRFSGCSRVVVSRVVRFSGCPFVDLCFRPSVLPSSCPLVHLDRLSICPSVLLSFCPSVLPSFRPSVLPSFRPPVLVVHLDRFVDRSFRPSVLLSFCPFGAPSRCCFESPGMLLGTLRLHVAASTMRREACMLLVGNRHRAYSA